LKSSRKVKAKLLQVLNHDENAPLSFERLPQLNKNAAFVAVPGACPELRRRRETGRLE
jgi:hypothetical protein